MTKNTDISRLRREYSLKVLDEKSVNRNPFEQFSLWMNEVLELNIIDSTAMIIATSDKNCKPSVRTVLLKEFSNDGFIFFTNYKSQKGSEILSNPKVEALFYWKEIERQVRISGKAKKISANKSEDYFHSRPIESQIAAWSSIQSRKIPHRKYLEDSFLNAKNKFAGKEIPLPPFWGGFKIVPDYFEFWQGRENRLHDRIVYSKSKSNWNIARLSP